MLVPAKVPAEKEMASIRMEVCFIAAPLLAFVCFTVNLRCIGSFPLPLGQNNVLSDY